ncbi:hypothetical protein BBH99_09675 [Chryseobacterium contaminans]|uniref:C1q domain-containing protein n=1 Tax=Chryseobacterium contaminans TaxID=1423959 RepID=A0A1M7GED8_9FLAO|nr:hypothetical protein [Chryseobacterium contaminans]OCA78148.1 hypothetical protein BBH99_09675 [Chryseobacterium contaminans]SHM14630.1 hypothetical protein SAMN05444407_1109 [Chryseobacterium contaminans]
MRRNLSFIVLCAGLIGLKMNAQVGVNTPNPTSSLTVNGSFAATYKTVSASGIIGPNDYYTAYNSANDGTLTLPAAINGAGNFAGRTYHFKNTGTGNLIIAANGTELIDTQTGAGVPNITIPAGYYAFLVSKGTVTGTTWELVLFSSSNSMPPVSQTYLFSSAQQNAVKQNCTATTGGAWVKTEIKYPQGMSINTANGVDLLTGRFTAPTEGYYMVYGSAQFDNSEVVGQPAFAWCVLYLVKNFTTTPNNQLVQNYHTNPGIFASGIVSAVVHLNAGETVSMASAAQLNNLGA